jgi:hypothetical protein
VGDPGIQREFPASFSFLEDSLMQVAKLWGRIQEVIAHDVAVIG